MKRINLSGNIGWEINVSDIQEQLDEAKGDDIEIYLASPGGSVFDGIQIYNAFRDYKRKYPESQMLLTITGLAASMASYIAVNPAFDLVAAEDNAILMIHNVWGGAIGDYRDLRKTADIFEGLTDLLSQAYSRKNGKTQKEIRDLMDAETWYYGNELLDNGYVDEIIETVEEKEKASAIATAKLEFQKMTEKLNEYKIDIQQIAAMIEPQNPYPNEHAARIRNPEDFQKDSFRRKNIESGIDIIIGKLKGKTTTTTQAYRFKKDKFTAAEAKKWLKDHNIKYISFEPASGSSNEQDPATNTRDNNIKEVLTMTLQEFLAQDPAAKKEYDDAIAQAKEAGKKEMQDLAEKVKPFVNNPGYPKNIAEASISVLKGEKSFDVLEAMVATADMINEKFKSNNAAGETPKDTPPDPNNNSQLSEEFQAEGTIKNETDLMTVINQHKVEKGMEVN